MPTIIHERALHSPLAQYFIAKRGNAIDLIAVSVVKWCLHNDPPSIWSESGQWPHFGIDIKI